MKSFIDILYIYLLSFLLNYSSSNLGGSVLSYPYISNNNFYNDDNPLFYQIYNEIDINDTNYTIPYNVSQAVIYLAPSYFTLIIKEIVPESTVIEFLRKSKCLNQYFIERNTTKILEIVKYSAKSYPDYGDEDGCLSINTNNAFILFTIKYDFHNITPYTGKFKLLPFISSGYSFYGLCIENIQECTNDLTDNIMKAVNSSIETINGLDNFIITYFLNYKNYKSDEKVNWAAFYSIYILYLIYIIARLVIWFIGSRFFKEKDILSKKRQNDDDSSSDDEEEEEDDESNSLSKNQDPAQNDLIEKNKIEKLSNEKLYPKFYYIYRISSLAESFHILFQKEGNSYYNETDLHFILFFRFLALIFKVLDENLKYIVQNPSKEINNTNLFNSQIIFFSKLASFSDIGFIITESIIVSYKLMSFIREYTPKNGQPSGKLFFNFFLRIIPSFFSILIIFISYYLFSDALILVLHFNDDRFYRTKMQHFKQNIMNCYSCTKKALNIIPFYMHYQDFGDQFASDKNCFQFILIMVNLFYCYCICILITYISSKLKKPLFDYIISIVFLIIYFLPNNLSCESYLTNHNYFNINLLFGETCSLKYTHLFIKYYFFGFLIGFGLFYNNDITKENSLQISDTYKPFNYLVGFVGFFFKSSVWMSVLIILLTLGIQVLLCASFLIYSKNGVTYDKLVGINLNGFDNFLYLNEKTIYTIAFVIFITHLYTYKNESKLKEFGNNIIIITFNRLGYGFYGLTEILINMIYSSFELNYSITAQNLLFIAYGIIFFLILSNLFLFVMNELPIKMLIKNYLHITKKEK